MFRKRVCKIWHRTLFFLGITGALLMSQNLVAGSFQFSCDLCSLNKCSYDYCFFFCPEFCSIPIPPKPDPDNEETSLGLGTPVEYNVYQAWDIDVSPNGRGLPEGQGTAKEGDIIYDKQCVKCHGYEGHGVDGKGPPLVFDPEKKPGKHKKCGIEKEEKELEPQKTVGTYWPYATTLFDYIHRAMPFPRPQSLEDSEVYAVVAYVLYLNKIIPEDDFEKPLDKETLLKIQMPNQHGFFTPNPQQDTHIAVPD
jgi:hypothetical protein